MQAFIVKCVSGAASALCALALVVGMGAYFKALYRAFLFGWGLL